MIELQGVHKAYDDFLLFEDLNISFPDGEVSVILGPSGCGKTTLLHMLAGIVAPDSGRIEGVADRRISYLFQEPRLIPWLTVGRNLELVLEGVYGKEKSRTLTRELLERMGIGESASAYPVELSGGMRQRAVIARAFAYPGEILLMDEPLQALDLARKLDLVGWFRELWSEKRPCTLFVTHDIQEALLLGDTIMVLSSPPSRIKRSFQNPLPPGERSLARSEINSLETQLYRELIGEAIG